MERRAGFAIKWHKFGMRGVEAVPNIDFWRQVPGLVFDGITLSVSKAKVAYGIASVKLFNGRLPSF